MGKHPKQKIPERWTEYKAIGDVIPGTQFIAFKVPLKSGYFDRLERSHASCIERFTTQDLLQKLKGKLVAVIDLSYKGVGLFYDPEDFESSGIKYEKLFTAGHVVPNNEIVKRFTSIVNKALMNKPKDKLIGVHCTHGVNRTGYLISRYMVENLNFTAEDAQIAFEKGRGYPMERKNYIESLQQIEKSLKSKEFNLSTANETQEVDEYNIPPHAWNDHQYQHDSNFYSDTYEEPYYDQYNYEDQSYDNDYNSFSRTRPSAFNSYQRRNFNEMQFPSDNSFLPHMSYDGYAHYDNCGRQGRYRPYERYGSNSGLHNRTHISKYRWSKTDQTNNKSATQNRNRNFRRRNPKGSHTHFE